MSTHTWGVQPDVPLQGIYNRHSGLLEQYRYNVHSAQEKLVQSLLDSGKDISQYTLHEQTWVEDNIMYYKCWAERRMYENHTR